MNDNVTSCGSLTTTNTADTITGSYYYDESSPNIEEWRYRYITAPYYELPPPPYNSSEQFNEAIKRLENKIEKNKGDEDMRHLYEVILVNPEDEEFEIFEVVAKNETSALMQAYGMSDFSGNEELDKVEFDNLKTQCRVLFEWKKEKSLEKALETVKKAIE